MPVFHFSRPCTYSFSASVCRGAYLLPLGSRFSAVVFYYSASRVLVLRGLGEFSFKLSQRLQFELHVVACHVKLVFRLFTPYVRALSEDN